MDKIELPATVSDLFSADAFAEIMQLQGQVYRDVAGRRTIQLKLAGGSYFVKQHFGVGWHEIVKSFLSLKKPILGAQTEVNAIRRLNEIGIETTPLVGYGVKGINPATQQSFVITQDLGDIISLEDLCANWNSNPPDANFKRRLIIEVAEVAAKLHKNGVNHRDFYICHLCLDAQALKQNQIKLYLIDLHRMLIHHKISMTDNMKDIAALYFSSMDAGLTLRDYLRFKRYYSSGVSGCTPYFWRQVEHRANKLYVKFHGEKFQKRLAAEKAALKK
ncbi:MAG: lipopolysaccharide core heptose(I) kinase RfaP [Methylotenera sp.]|nr:lipopolysaccharide core heptose(I) kinase RfaP [Methylotenera sp.]MDD4925181.1 lipopolysaccharide core heptose(I) kinase RfaP [Methylotenera sp.]